MPIARTVIAAIALAAAPAHAQDFYRGKTINFVVSADAGNSYDTLFAAAIGNGLEWYDFGVYAFFFEQRGLLAGTSLKGTKITKIEG